MQAPDLRTWLPKSRDWSPPYEWSAFQVEDETPATVSAADLPMLLDCAAFTGGSAFIDICFDLVETEH
jgi:hypothetical protein